MENSGTVCILLYRFLLLRLVFCSKSFR